MVIRLNEMFLTNENFYISKLFMGSLFSGCSSTCEGLLRTGFENLAV
jgi:hypothetical protein